MPPASPLWFPMRLLTNIDATARKWFAVRTLKGGQPQRVLGGALDGLCYYEIDLDGRSYWLTERGLLTPRSPLCPQRDYR